MKSKENNNEKDYFVDLKGRSKLYAQVVQFGLIIAVIGLLLKYSLLLYGLDTINGFVGSLFGGIADFGGLIGIVGFSLLVFGLLSLALLGNRVHLYLRIGILIATALIIRSFLSNSFFM